MFKKYSYQIEFLTKDVSPVDTKFYSATAECTLNEMKKKFKSFISTHGLQTKGSTTKGTVLDARGNMIGTFSFGSTTIE